MRHRLCILHWMPVEDFPPAMNMVKYFGQQHDWEVSLCTNRHHLDRPEFLHETGEVIRGVFPTGTSGIRRLLAYASFHLKSFVHLMKTRPDTILYIEPHSVFPVVLSRLFTRRARIFAHFHEYHSPDEYEKPGMRMARWFHKLEKRWVFPKVAWISQTNLQRLELFLRDNPEIDKSRAQVLSNFPPLCWWQTQNQAWSKNNRADEPIRFVYVGALSRADTFIEETVIWIAQLGPLKASLDIYCYNMHPETREWLRTVADKQIRVHESGIAYEELPGLLSEFHVGLILYKGNTPNYVHNASNKLFEYLSCGLDVLYPFQMAGVRPYRISARVPRVVECDFSNLTELTYTREGRTTLQPLSQLYDCESEYERLALQMTGAY